MPIAAGSHDAASWLGWSYSGQAAGVFISGSLFGNSTWGGMSFGLTVFKGGGGYSALYYRYAGETNNPYKIQNTCLCNLLRYVNKSDNSGYIMSEVLMIYVAATSMGN